MCVDEFLAQPVQKNLRLVWHHTVGRMPTISRLFQYLFPDAVAIFSLGKTPLQEQEIHKFFNDMKYSSRIIVRIARNNLSVKHICLVYYTREALQVGTNAFGPQKPTPSLRTETRTPSAILDTEKAWAPPPVSPGSLVPRVDDWKRDWLGNFFHGSVYWEHSWIPSLVVWGLTTYYLLLILCTDVPIPDGEKL